MRASFGCLALLALAAVGVVDVSAGVNISADECKPCGSSTCFSRLCRAGVCGTAFVTSKFVASGYIVNMPSPCEEGRYTCAEDPDDASLVCNRGACAFSAPCAPPRRGDVRLQSTELADLLELRLGQTPSAPPSGLLMVYGLGEKDRWSLACADASQARERAADVVCRQLGYSRAASAKMVQILPLLDRLKAALGGAGSTSDGIAAFGSEIKNLYGPVFGRISGSATFNMRACTSARELADEAIAAAMGVGSTPSPSSGGHGGRKLTEAEEPPRTLANCTGASLVVRACSRTNALHVSCAPEPLPPDPLPKQQHGDRALPQQHPTMACGTSGVSKLRPCAGPKAASASLGPGSALESIVPGGGRVCPPLFLPSPSVVGGGEYCVHYPHHASVSPEQRERSFRARVAAGLARGASSAPLPADSEAAADEESMRACEEAVSTGDFGATMDRCAAASGFVHPAAAAALAQAYANGENDAAAKAAAEAAGIEGLNALLAASTPPPADPLAGVTLPPVVCFLGKVEHASAADSWDSSGLLQVAGASPNAGNVTACEAFDTRVHCPSDRWAAVLLPSGSFLCAGTAPPPPPPPPRLPADVKSAAGVFPGAPAPFVLCHQTGPNPLSVAACEPRQEPTVPEEASSPIGIHLDPRPTARPPGANGLVEEEGSDDDCAFVLPSKVTEQGLSPAGCARSPLQPVLCAGGVFCPNLFRREVCPQGTFCWQGAVEPAPCSADLLGGVVGGTLFGSLFEPLLGAAPSGSSSACRPGTNRPPPRTDFVILLSLILAIAIFGFGVYDRARAARTATLMALGEDTGGAQRSTTSLYVELDQLYAKAAAQLAPALTPRLRSVAERRATYAGASVRPMSLGTPSLAHISISQWIFDKWAEMTNTVVSHLPPWAEELLERVKAQWARLRAAAAVAVGHPAEPPPAYAPNGSAAQVYGLPGHGSHAHPPNSTGSFGTFGAYVPYGHSSAQRRALNFESLSPPTRPPSPGGRRIGSDDEDEEVVVPPAMNAIVERARRRQADGLSAIHPDSEAPFARLPDRISFQFKRLGMKVRAPAAVIARRRKAAAERTVGRRHSTVALSPGEDGWLEVLHSVSGSIDHSTLTAIMGVSGCGKSTFMNVLCGRAQYGIPTGTLRVNNHPSEGSLYRNRMGYVPQDDTVRESLTVYENILFAARLRLPRGTAEARVRGLVHEVIEMLGLQSVRDSVVGSAEVRGISGGQRKRVNIGLELAADPLALFLDEPTSGLDACTAELVLSALRALARRGRTVVMVLHQPRYTAFKLLDRLILLGVGGRTLFCGEPLKVVPYFASVGYQMRYGENPADFMLDVVSGLVPRENRRVAHPAIEPDKQRAAGRWRMAGSAASMAGSTSQSVRARSVSGGGARSVSGKNASGGNDQPPSPTGTAEPPDEKPKRAREVRMVGKPTGRESTAGGAATTEVLAKCWAAVGHTIGEFANEAAPVTALFTQEQQSAVLRVFDATIDAAWPEADRERAREEMAAEGPPTGGSLKIHGGIGEGRGRRESFGSTATDGTAREVAAPSAHDPTLPPSSRLSAKNSNSAYIFRDSLEALASSHGVVLPSGVKLSREASKARARNRWQAAARAVAAGVRQPAAGPGRLSLRRFNPATLRVHVGPGAAAAAANEAEASTEAGGDDDDGDDETASLPDIPAPPTCHTRSRRLARNHPYLLKTLARAAASGSLPVGDWAAFMQGLQDLASMSVLSRAQTDLVSTCLHEQLLRASDAAGRPLVSGAMGGSAPGSPNGSVAEEADDEEQYFETGDDAPAAEDQLFEWDRETAAEAMGVVCARAELEALLRITDENAVDGLPLELQRNGKLSASDYYDYQVEVYNLPGAEIWAKWSRLQQQQLAGETAGLGSLRPHSTDFPAVTAVEASTRRLQPREPPSFFEQLRTLIASYAVQQRRLAAGSGALAEWAALVVVGAFVGVLQRSQLPDGYEKLPTIYVLTLTLFSLFVALPAVRTFAFDTQSFWREASAGVSPTAFYVSRALADLPGLAMRALVFALVFWSCAFWNGPFGTLLLLLLDVMLCASGLAYVIAITVPPSLAVTVCGVLICSLCGFFAGIVPTYAEAGPLMKLMLELSYGRWATQCLASADFSNIPNALYAEQGRQLIAMFAWPSAEELASLGRGPCTQPLGVLLALGLALRVLGCVAINYANGSQFGRPPFCAPAPRVALRPGSRRPNAKGGGGRPRISRKPLLLGQHRVMSSSML